MLSFEEALQQLQEALADDERVKTFLAYQKALEADPEVQTLNARLVEAQKTLTRAFPSPNEHQKAKIAYEEAKAVYENHPLVANFLHIQEEIKDLLTQIKTQLE